MTPHQELATIAQDALAEVQRLKEENARLREALEYIARIGCMQSKEEEEFFCKHDGSGHSCYCPEGLARAALAGKGDGT